MKKFLVFAVSGVFALGIAACGDDDDENGGGGRRRRGRPLR